MCPSAGSARATACSRRSASRARAKVRAPLARSAVSARLMSAVAAAAAMRKGWAMKQNKLLLFFLNLRSPPRSSLSHSAVAQCSRGHASCRALLLPAFLVGVLKVRSFRCALVLRSLQLTLPLSHDTQPFSQLSTMKAFSLLVACLSLSSAIVIEIFTDSQCTVSLGNSSIYTGYAGICNTATTPDSGLSIGIDFCSPNAINMSVYRFAVAGADEAWGGSFTCATPDQADARISLKLGACTPVFPCSDCVQQYFRLWDTQCNAPAPVLIVQQDRGVVFGGPPPLPCSDFLFLQQVRFQSRELLTGICNPRTASGNPQCSWIIGGGNTNCVSGDPNCFPPTCRRFDVNFLSILPQPTPTGIVFSMYDGDTCSGMPLMTYPNIPIQDSSSNFCTVIAGAPLGAVARHGLRAYNALPYVTVFSATSSTTTTLSASTTPTPSAPPTNVAAAAAAASAALSTETSALIGVSVTGFFLIAGLGAALVYVLKVRPPPSSLPPPGKFVAEWGQKSGATVEMAPLPQGAPAAAGPFDAAGALPGSVQGQVTRNPLPPPPPPVPPPPGPPRAPLA